VSDEQWSFVAPYLALVREDAPQRVHNLREVFDALRWIVRAGASWRMLPHDFPPWEAVYQQTRRWLRAGVFEEVVHDIRALLRLASGRAPDSTAAILDSRTLRSTPESGHRAGYDGAKRKKGSKVHAAVDTLGHLLALHVTPATEQDRAQVEELVRSVQEATGESVELAYVDRGYTGEEPAEAAKANGIRLELVKHPATKKGLRAVAASMGSGTQLRMGDALPAAGQGLRAAARYSSGAAFRCFRMPLPLPSYTCIWVESITCSSEDALR